MKTGRRFIALPQRRCISGQGYDVPHINDAMRRRRDRASAFSFAHGDMATLTKKLEKKKQLNERRERFACSRDIRESLSVSGNVDRTNAIIRHVKVLSKHSPNRHNMPGVDGTTYEPTFHEQIKDVLESGMEVNIGHPPKGEPDMERRPEDRNGVLVNPSIENGETFADWHLNKDHAMTPRILTAAEKPELHSQYALSINARGYGDVRNRRYCLVELQPPGLRSVDLVTRGGANRTLFEGAEMKKPFKEHIASASEAVKAWWKNVGDRAATSTDLLEMYEDMEATPTEAPVAAEETPEEEPGWEQHCATMVKGIVDAIVAGDLTPDEATKKIVAAVKLLKDEEEEGETGDGDGKAIDDKEGDETEEEKKDALESRELQFLRAKDGARDLCESLEFVPTAEQVGKLAKLADDKARVKEIVKLKAAKKTPQQTGPYTASGRNVFESRAADPKTTPNYDDQSPEARAKRLARIKG